MANKSGQGITAAGLRALCRPWPGVVAEIKWESNLVFSVGDKMFAMMSDGENGRLSFKVADERFLELTDQPGIIPAPYLARAHWVSIDQPQHFSTDALQAFVRDAYGLVRAKLTRKLQATLGPLPPSKAAKK